MILPGILVAGLAVAPTPTLLSPAQKRAASVIRQEKLRADIRFLASDLLEGRGPASTGDRLTQAYIASRMEGLGLEPGAADGSWLQPVEVVGVRSRGPETMRIERGHETLDLKSYDDYVAYSGIAEPQSKLEAAEIVFVGYGIVAPEFQWDDFKGADLKGKLLLVMNNDPEDDPRLFGGKTRLYYGRWPYKYQMAARQGASGAIIIHTTPSAGYKWQVVQTSNSGEVFSLAGGAGPKLPVRAWATEDACRRIAQLAGRDLDELRAAAQRRDFVPVPLGVKVSFALANEVRDKRTANVIGKLKGSDPALASEAVLYTAHHDHLGRKPDAPPGEDAIYNGALDNASGVAVILAVAEAFKALPQPPRRTVYFAAVAAEEQGLLGSEFLAEHPPLPAGRIAANINVDGIGIWGRTRDVVLLGLGKSSLDDYVVALAASQGRKVVPDQFPDRGFFYRSDQFNFAKIGVPAVHLEAGTDVVGRPEGWGREQRERFEATDYHQPSDELRPEWDFSGAIEDAQLCFHLGTKVANAQRPPAWKPGDEFEAARKKALAELPPAH